MSKPVVLIFPFGLLAHYLRCLELATSLSDRYEILFAAHPSYDRYVSSYSFKTFPCQQLPAQEIVKQVADFYFSWLNTKSLYSVYTGQVDAITRYGARMVVGDYSPTLKWRLLKTVFIIFL